MELASLFSTEISKIRGSKWLLDFRFGISLGTFFVTLLYSVVVIIITLVARNSWESWESYYECIRKSWNAHFMQKNCPSLIFHLVTAWKLMVPLKRIQFKLIRYPKGEAQFVWSKLQLHRLTQNWNRLKRNLVCICYDLYTIRVHKHLCGISEFFGCNNIFCCIEIFCGVKSFIGIVVSLRKIQCDPLNCLRKK